MKHTFSGSISRYYFLSSPATENFLDVEVNWNCVSLKGILYVILRVTGGNFIIGSLDKTLSCICLFL